jgi:hypothetical protein
VLLARGPKDRSRSAQGLKQDPFACLAAWSPLDAPRGARLTAQLAAAQSDEAARIFGQALAAASL